MQRSIFLKETLAKLQIFVTKNKKEKTEIREIPKILGKNATKLFIVTMNLNDEI